MVNSINDLKRLAGINESIPPATAKMFSYFGVNDTRDIGQSDKFDSFIKSIGIDPNTVIGYATSGGTIDIVTDVEVRTFDFASDTSIRSNMFHKL